MENRSRKPHRAESRRTNIERHEPREPPSLFASVNEWALQGIDPSFGACPVRVRCPQTLCQSRDAALPNAILGPSECEIYPSTNHAKVVVWTIHYIPTKIVYPADMRCKANFDATAKLPDAPGFGAGLFSVKKR
jgi:hypothetical protein